MPAIIITLLIAHMIHTLVEKPCLDLLRKTKKPKT